jgi:hypothetical protein
LLDLAFQAVAFLPIRIQHQGGFRGGRGGCGNRGGDGWALAGRQTKAGSGQQGGGGGSFHEEKEGYGRFRRQQARTIQPIYQSGPG